MIVVCCLVDFENDSSNRSAVKHNAISLILRIVHASLNRLARYDLSVIIDVVVSHSELFNRPEPE